MASSIEVKHQRLPVWLRRPPGSASSAVAIKRVLRESTLNTVCEEARCPNISECFSRGTATFMILGDVCTRGCRFCAVTTGKPHFSSSAFADEAHKLAQAAKNLNLKHVVVTSVARDDLADGGASGFVATIHALREAISGVKVEVLIPDLRGNWSALTQILDAAPDVLNHNLETVPRLYRRVRPGASYQRSLDLLKLAAQAAQQPVVKTGIMLGLGEEISEVQALMDDCLAVGVQSFTAGQYMRPTREHLAVERYLEPAEFAHFERYANDIGFKYVAIGPLVRSSYNAEQYLKA